MFYRLSLILCILCKVELLYYRLSMSQMNPAMVSMAIKCFNNVLSHQSQRIILEPRRTLWLIIQLKLIHRVTCVCSMHLNYA
uniref:Putative secreted protein n=1 Tax=Anopheles marajoara TaxID=58244 RepID=A0A2M4CBI9_9DIPT